MSEIAYRKGVQSPVSEKKKKHRKKSDRKGTSTEQIPQNGSTTNGGVFEQSQGQEHLSDARLSSLFTLNNRLEDILEKRKAGDTIDLTLTTEVYQEHISKLEKKYEKNLKAQLADAIRERDEAKDANIELEKRIRDLEYKYVPCILTSHTLYNVYQALCILFVC